jgi:hypothetical protein
MARQAATGGREDRRGTDRGDRTGRRPRDGERAPDGRSAADGWWTAAPPPADGRHGADDGRHGAGDGRRGAEDGRHGAEDARRGDGEPSGAPERNHRWTDPAGFPVPLIGTPGRRSTPADARPADRWPALPDAPADRWPALPQDAPGHRAAPVPPGWSAGTDLQAGADAGASGPGRGDPWPALPDDGELWTLPAPAVDPAQLRRLDTEQAGG